jgi:hypothetical protein
MRRCHAPSDSDAGRMQHARRQRVTLVGYPESAARRRNEPVLTHRQKATELNVESCRAVPAPVSKYPDQHTVQIKRPTSADSPDARSGQMRTARAARLRE